jgi:hypothetical protein
MHVKLTVYMTESRELYIQPYNGCLLRYTFRQFPKAGHYNQIMEPCHSICDFAVLVDVRAAVVHEVKTLDLDKLNKLLVPLTHLQPCNLKDKTIKHPDWYGNMRTWRFYGPKSETVE